MRKRTIYLAGPMKGYFRKNFDTFERVTALLRQKGHFVYSPHEYPDNVDRQIEFDMRKAFSMYTSFICLQADTIVLLPGWEASKGANIERELAEVCGLDVLIWDEDNNTTSKLVREDA